MPVTQAVASVKPEQNSCLNKVDGYLLKATSCP